MCFYFPLTYSETFNVLFPLNMPPFSDSNASAMTCDMYQLFPLHVITVYLPPLYTLIPSSEFLLDTHVVSPECASVVTSCGCACMVDLHVRAVAQNSDVSIAVDTELCNAGVADLQKCSAHCLSICTTGFCMEPHHSYKMQIQFARFRSGPVH